MHVSDTLIFLGASGLSLPLASERVVRVRDAQGQPVDGLPVVFSAEPSWTQNVSFTPPEARTRHGVSGILKLRSKVVLENNNGPLMQLATEGPPLFRSSLQQDVQVSCHEGDPGEPGAADVPSDRRAAG